MRDSIDFYIKILNNELPSDDVMTARALIALKERIKDLQPLFYECDIKDIDLSKLCPELVDEWNTIVLITRNK